MGYSERFLGCDFEEVAERVRLAFDEPVLLSSVFEGRGKSFIGREDALILRCAIAHRDIVGAVFGKYPVGRRLTEEERLLVRFSSAHLNQTWERKLPFPRYLYGAVSGTSGLSGLWRIRKECSPTAQKRGYEVLEPVKGSGAQGFIPEWWDDESLLSE